MPSEYISAMPEGSNQNSKPPIYKRKWFIIVVVILVLAIIGSISSGNKNSSSSNSDAQSSSSQSAEAATSQSSSYSASPEAEQTTETEVIYPASESVNRFVTAFNAAHPDLAISADDLTVYHHHGSDHPGQVWTHLGDDRVLISGMSVYYETYSENSVVQDYAEANHRVFTLVMPILNPELNAEDVEARWQEVLDDLIHSPKWDDGVSFESGHDSDAGGPGSYNYIKLSKK